MNDSDHQNARTGTDEHDGALAYKNEGNVGLLDLLSLPREGSWTAAVARGTMRGFLAAMDGGSPV